MFRQHWHFTSDRAVPGIRSTFGTGTELLNSLRLMYSRLASPSLSQWTLSEANSCMWRLVQELICPECGAHFYAPSAEELAFNSQGACPSGVAVREVCGQWILIHLVPDDYISRLMMGRWHPGTVSCGR